MESSLAQLLFSGLKLMLIGMGIVYLFLSLLVWIIGVTAKLLQRYSPETEVLPAHPGPGSAAAEDAEIVAAIAAALHRFQHP